MSRSYTVLPAFYDFLGEHPDYDANARAILARYQADGAKESGLILDLACGTGRLTAALMDGGGDLIGVDLSPEMLNVARENCAKKGHTPLLLCQDMRALDLYGTVDVAVCADNSLNYLESAADLFPVFDRVHNFLTPGGLFFFDVNSLYKFERLYGENSYIFECDGCFCAWQNDYRPKRKTCAFCIDLFEETPDGRYERKSEVQKQRYFSEKEIKKALTNAGFELIFRAGGYDERPLAADAAEVYYLARCKK